MATRGPTLLIGSDIPEVTAAHIARAFKALGAAKTVIGPARDGGFWLVGLKHPAKAPEHAFRQHPLVAPGHTGKNAAQTCHAPWPLPTPWPMWTPPTIFETGVFIAFKNTPAGGAKFFAKNFATATSKGRRNTFPP